MPTYEFDCPSCERRYEQFYGRFITPEEKGGQRCDDCDVPLKFVYSGGIAATKPRTGSQNLASLLAEHDAKFKDGPSAPFEPDYPDDDII